MSDIFAGDTIDRALVQEVAGWAESRLVEPFSLMGLSEVEADVLGTITAAGVIGNGGFTLWYEGKNRDETLAVATSFDRMGVGAVAQAMRQSMSAFPDGSPPQDLRERQDYVSKHRAELMARFEQLDRTIWDCNYDLAAARYVFRRRRELLALEPGFGPLLQRFEAADRGRSARLLAAASGLGSDERAHCERAVESGDLTAALDQAISSGADLGAASWRNLAEVARALGHGTRAERCDGWCRVAGKGALRVAVQFVPGGELESGGRSYQNGHKLSWNAGPAPGGLFRAHRAELFFVDRSWANSGDQAEAFLVPGDQTIVSGTEIVLHQDGEVIGRGQVLERRQPRPA